MSEQSYETVKEWLKAMIDHGLEVIPDPLSSEEEADIAYLSQDGEAYSISRRNIRKSLKDYAPNSDLVLLVTRAIKTNEGRENLANYINKEWKRKDEPEEEDENALALSALEEIEKEDDPVQEDQVINNADQCAKTLLQTLSQTSLEEWKQNSIYCRLLSDVLTGNGPKGEWLEIVLKNI
jgi:hypothetical protein